MPQLDFSTYLGQFCWLIVSFALCYAFIHCFFFPRLEKRLGSRASLIGNNLAAAEHAIDEVNKLRIAIDQKLEDANTQASIMLREAENQIKVMLDMQTMKHNQAHAEIIKKEHDRLEKHNAMMINKLMPVIMNELKYEIASTVIKQTNFTGH